MKRRIALIEDWASAQDRHKLEPDPRVAQLADSLARRGYQVDIFTCQQAWEWPESELWQETVQVVRVPVSLRQSTEDSPDEVQEFASFVINFCERQEKSYDLIHASFGPSGLVAAVLKSRLGIPFVITFQSPEKPTGDSRETGLVIAEEAVLCQDRVVREADGIIALNLQDQEDLISLYHADPTYIVQIPDQEAGASSGTNVWNARAEMLTAFYEDVLAVRRVTILPRTTAPLLWDSDLRAGSQTRGELELFSDIALHVPGVDAPGAAKQGALSVPHVLPDLLYKNRAAYRLFDVGSNISLSESFLE